MVEAGDKMSVCYGDQLYVIGIDETSAGKDVTNLVFRTNRGNFTATLRARKHTRASLILLGDSDEKRTDLFSITPELANDLLSKGIGSLELHYREPGDCVQCAIDSLVAVQYLDDEGVCDIVLAGCAFGGAVAIAAGALARIVRGIIAVSTMGVADCCIKRVENKPMLLISGAKDTVTPLDVSRRISAGLPECRKLVIYPETGHDLSAAKDFLRRDVLEWVIGLFPMQRAVA